MTHLGVVKKYTKIDFGIIIFNVADEGNVLVYKLTENRNAAAVHLM